MRFLLVSALYPPSYKVWFCLFFKAFMIEGSFRVLFIVG